VARNTNPARWGDYHPNWCRCDKCAPRRSSRLLVALLIAIIVAGAIAIATGQAPA
jgi:hypothetical protein